MVCHDDVQSFQMLQRGDTSTLVQLRGTIHVPLQGIESDQFQSSPSRSGSEIEEFIPR